MTTPAIGASSSAPKAMMVMIGFEPRLSPPKNAMRSRMSASSAITPTSSATRVIRRTSRLRMCATSWASTAFQLPLFHQLHQPRRHGHEGLLGAAAGGECVRRLVLHEPQFGRLLQPGGDGDVLEQAVEVRVVALLDLLGARDAGDHAVGREPGDERVRDAADGDEREDRRVEDEGQQQAEPDHE